MTWKEAYFCGVNQLNIDLVANNTRSKRRAIDNDAFSTATQFSKDATKL